MCLLYRSEPETVAKVLCVRLKDRTRGACPQSLCALRKIMMSGLWGVVVVEMGVYKC
jgi:hypothetical protein